VTQRCSTFAIYFAGTDSSSILSGASAPSLRVSHLPGVSEDEYYMIGPTDESRVWRLTYERPFAVRTRDLGLQLKSAPANFLAQCCFSERSEWIDEFTFGPFFAHYVPTHYVFTLLDHIVEILGDKSPENEEVENTLTSDSNG
jgi:hypothetical protein